MYGILVFLHVTANVVWIGSILAVAVLLSTAGADGKTRGDLAHGVYKKLSAPAFGVSFIAGGARLVLTLPYYFVDTKFMHGKLFFAVIVIALHHVIGARARRLSTGAASTAGPAGLLGVLLFAAAAAAVFFVVVKPF